MTASNEAPTAVSTSADRSRAVTRIPWAAGQVLLLARHILLEYLRGGWILVELAYVLALYLFAFSYPFEPPFFFETANWGLGLLALFATLLLVARAMRPAVAQPAIASVSRRTYVASVMLATATLRIINYLALLALVLLSRRLINATGSALLAGSLGLITSCIVLAALALALSPAFTPQPAPSSISPERRGIPRRADGSDILVALWQRRHLIILAWLTAALYSYTATDALAAFFFVGRLPLLPLFACYEMGLTGSIGWGGVLSLMIDAGYVVGLVLLAASWRQHQDAALAGDTSAGAEAAPGANTPASSLAISPDPAAAKPGAVQSVPRASGHDAPSQAAQPSPPHQPARTVVATPATRSTPLPTTGRPSPARRKRSSSRKRSSH